MLSGLDVVAINNLGPECKEADLGTEIISTQKRVGMESDVISPILGFEYDIVADASAGVTILASAPFALKVVDVIVESRATSASGTVKLTNGTNDITNAIVCAVDKTVGRAGTIDDAYSTIAQGGVLAIAVNSSTDRGLVTVKLKRI